MTEVNFSVCICFVYLFLSFVVEDVSGNYPEAQHRELLYVWSVSKIAEQRKFATPGSYYLKK